MWELLCVKKDIQKETHLIENILSWPPALFTLGAFFLFLYSYYTTLQYRSFYDNKTVLTHMQQEGQSQN